MNDREQSGEWIRLAEMDLGAAEHLLSMHPLPVEIICYHCEQSAEKILKGALAAFHTEPPKTHDLVQLCKLCSEMDGRYAELADACIELTPYGVQVRYPSDLELDERDVACALRECRKIHAFAQRIVQQMAEEQQNTEQQMI